jgi:hypothetical protein
MWHGWSTLSGGEVYMIGTSAGNLNGRKVATCTVSTKDVRANKLSSLVEKHMKAKILASETEMMQRYDAWNVEHNGSKMLAQLTTAADTQISPAATLSIMGYMP